VGSRNRDLPHETEQPEVWRADLILKVEPKRLPDKGQRLEDGLARTRHPFVG
jgi:hypothetical protein